jgi:Superfamily II DNA helicase
MHEQYLHRCKISNLTCQTWSRETSVQTPPRNILVTIEHTDSKAFHNFAITLLLTRMLARIIVDEPHLILSHEKFRPIMHTLKWLGQQNTQVALTTATLPPSLEQDLFKAVGITTATVCRSKTSRPNISFNVVRCTMSTLDNTLVAEYHKFLHKPGAKQALVFCLSKADVERVSGLLGVPYCHSEMTEEQVDTLLARFRRGDFKAIVTTSLLGVALDVADVTDVFHLDYPRDILSFAQEVGRGGRNSSLAWSTVIAPTDGQPCYPENDQFGARLVRDALDNDTLCRRLLVQMFLDGQAEPCAMMEGITHLCDVCARSALTPPLRSDSSVFPPDLLGRYTSHTSQLTFSRP